MLQIAMLVIGIIVLVTGKLTLTKKKVVTGGPARLLGVLMLSPLPLGFMLGLALGVAFGVQGQTGEDAQRSLRLYAVLIDVGLVIGIGVLVVILANLWGQDPNRAAEAQLVDDYARPLPPRSTSNNPYEPPATN